MKKVLGVTRLFTVLTLLFSLFPATITAQRMTGDEVGPLASRQEKTAQAGSPLIQPQLFVPNTGQWPDPVRFQMRTGNQTWWFRDEAVWVSVRRKERASLDKGRAAQALGHEGGRIKKLLTLSEPSSLKGVNLKLTFEGLSPLAHLVPAEPQPGHMNYFHSADASKWHTNVPTYGSLRWEGVYPGISLEFNQAGIQVISNLQLRLDGANSVYSAPDGTLIADTAIGPIPLPTFTTITGQPLTVTIQLDSSSDPVPWSPNPLVTRSPGHPVTLSPSSPVPLSSSLSSPSSSSSLKYSTYLGGSSSECNNLEAHCDIAIDATGAAYVVGETFSTDFPTTPGSFDGSYATQGDVFVSKLDPTGAFLEYSTYLGGIGGDNVMSVSVSASGQVYISGATTSPDFPTTPGSFDTSFNGSGQYHGGDAFIAALTPNGDGLVYSTFLGGTGDECLHGCELALGADNTAYIGGDTYSLDFPTTPGAYDDRCGCNFGIYYDAFVARLDTTGSNLVYSTYLGGDNSEWITGIAVDSAGAAYLAGGTYGDFPTTPGAFDRVADSEISGFVTKLDPDGSGLGYSTYLGGRRSQCGTRCTVAVDRDGFAYVTGDTNSYDFPVTPGAYDTTLNNSNFYTDAFVTKLNADASGLIYSTFLGGSDDDHSNSLALAADGTVYTTGYTESDTFPTTPGAFDTSYNGTLLSGDAFVTAIRADGSALVYSTFLGGAYSDCDFGCALAVGTTGAVYVAGNTRSADFPTSPEAFDTHLDGNSDIFVTQLEIRPLPITTHVAGIEPGYVPVGDGYRVGARIAVRYHDGSPVPDAEVDTDVQLPGGRFLNIPAHTDANGIATLSSLTRQTGTYRFLVTNIVKAGTLYAPGENAETRDSITIPG